MNRFSIRNLSASLRLVAFLCIFLPFAAVFSSCTPEEPDPLADYDSNRSGVELSLNRNTWDVSADSSRTVLRIKSSYLWYIEIPDEAKDWLTASQMWGDSLQTYKVYLYATQNDSPEPRKAIVTVRSGKSKKRLTVTQGVAPLVLTEADVPDFDKYYKPKEFTFDMLRSDSKWSWCRSKQSEHFVVFWDKQYGEYGLYGDRKGTANTSPSTCSVTGMVVDIDDLLMKAELFYEMNINTLKFADVGKGKSVLDRYKMEIYLLYQGEWLATGSGYDNVIGALWVNPSTCKPVGSTIAHEIGHSFQYMVFCDYLEQKGVPESQRPSANTTQGPGWRYGFGPNGSGGCGWWEQCAQWQSLQEFSAKENYKPQAFQGWAGEFTTSTSLHVLHERPRYANYFIQWYWVDKYGIDFIGKLWRESRYPEDPCETYMRLAGMDNAAFNDDMWRYAAHCVTYDMGEIRSYGKNYVGNVAITNFAKVDGWWRISDSKAPESTGSNAILLNGAAGQTVSANFQGLYEMQGSVYKCGPQGNAGWRYGFVSYNKDGSTTYGDIFSDAEGTATFNVPANSSKLWFVVCGAPKSYERHAWPTDASKSDTDTDDNKWPWQVQFSGTNPYGK
ncbi:MAG: BACON domain-containing protein [Bacteroidaceae bacterium]|nr:BACON domain-containing protein [Bacteroidaceae bacterium]